MKNIFFLKLLLLQSNVVFDSESNDCNFSTLDPQVARKKNIFFYIMTSLVGVRVFFLLKMFYFFDKMIEISSKLIDFYIV